MRKATLDEKGRVISLEKVEEEKSQAYQDRIKYVQECVAKKYGFNKGTR